MTEHTVQGELAHPSALISEPGSLDLRLRRSVEQRKPVLGWILGSRLVVVEPILRVVIFFGCGSRRDVLKPAVGISVDSDPDVVGTGPWQVWDHIMSALIRHDGLARPAGRRGVDLGDPGSSQWMPGLVLDHSRDPVSRCLSFSRQ